MCGAAPPAGAPCPPTAPLSAPAFLSSRPITGCRSITGTPMCHAACAASWLLLTLPRPSSGRPPSAIPDAGRAGAAPPAPPINHRCETSPLIHQHSPPPKQRCCHNRHLTWKRPLQLAKCPGPRLVCCCLRCHPLASPCRARYSSSPTPMVPPPGRLLFAHSSTATRHDSPRSAAWNSTCASFISFPKSRRTTLGSL
jgi:hypothetical protein